MKIRFLLLVLSVFFISVSAQQFDEKFLKSLPKGVAADFQKQLGSTLKEPEKNIVTPETRIENLEKALQDAKRTISNIEKDLGNNYTDQGELLRFGDKFFQSYQSTFLPINQPNSQSSYLLDYGDKVNIQLVGQRNDIYELEIMRTGAVNLEEVGEITLAGLSLTDAGNLIKNVVSQKFIGTDAFLTLRELRDMNIMIVGNVKNPGMYTISGGSTLLTLLNAAGGVDQNGSYRSILHKRDGQTINQVDLYDVFINGDLSPLSQLRSGDSVLIAPAGKEIQISGGIATPAIYEIKSKENLKDLLRFSGYRQSTNTSSDITIDRRINGTFTKLEIDILNESNIDLIDGDSIEIPHIKPIFNQAKKVTITGEVNIPGTYYIRDNTRLSDLIKMAGSYTKDAYPLGGVFTRESVKALESSLKEKSYNELIRFLIASQGGVGLRSTLSSTQLVSFLSLLREYEPTGRLISEFELSKLEGNPYDDRMLEGGDSIHIPSFMNQVYIFGEVLNPSAYSYSPGSSIKDYLKMSGGFSRSADESRVIIIHPNGRADAIEFGLMNNLFSSEQILPGSLIYVPQYIGKVDGISLAGAVAPIVSSFALSIASLNSINN